MSNNAGVKKGSTKGPVRFNFRFNSVLGVEMGRIECKYDDPLKVALTHLVCAVQCIDSAPLNYAKCGILELMTCASKLNKDVNMISL